MPTINVVATNGDIRKRIIWIDITPNGIYYDIVILGQNRHLTLHKDGGMYAHHHGIGDVERIGQLKPISNFTGSYRLASFTFSRDIANVPTADHAKKKSKKSVTYEIDAKSYPFTKQIVCDITVVEPQRQDFIAEIKPITCEKYVYSQFFTLDCNIKLWNQLTRLALSNLTPSLAGLLKIKIMDTIERSRHCRQGILEPTRKKKEIICHNCGWTPIQVTLAEYV